MDERAGTAHEDKRRGQPPRAAKTTRDTANQAGKAREEQPQIKRPEQEEQGEGRRRKGGREGEGKPAEGRTGNREQRKERETCKPPPER